MKESNVVNVNFQATKDELEKYKKDAQAKHMTLSGYIRFLLIINSGKSISDLLVTVSK